ncbi:hypothetical protein MRS76_03155 [Rhizobiaceae bacterium n13]|uniref:Antifreeze protein n=1 Tax=Ferirhizobium litorale TaxID=2927786 RepID=A0AAE3Q8E3_9HYPH|nr:hypothetical protein [Fererhizobium litorale]MDI7860944.1 hypothetical protein [Fererhizobium litorale]MDI7921092.1 hypothetical protein [Fererhizobium litorale]
MTQFFAKAGLAALIAFGAISATASTAAAQDVGFGFYVGNGGYYQPRPYYPRPVYRPRVCSPGQAIEKARWNGLRRARVAQVGPRRVVVEGTGRYGWGRMVFANVPGCPLIHR